MRPDIGEKEMKAIHAVAGGFKRNPVFSGYSTADIAQDMALFVWQYAEKYDPDRGDWLAFVKSHARACGHNLIDRRTSSNARIGRMKMRVRGAISIDEPLAAGAGGESMAMADTLPDGRPPLDGEVAFSLDFEALLSTFHSEMRQAARRLPTRTIREVAAELGMPVTTFRRRVYEPLREALAVFRKNRASA